MNVSAVLVTRGDVDLSPVLATLPFDDVIVYDNSKEQNYKVYGRYVAMKRAKHDRIFVQDDDCLTNPAAIVAQYQQGYITANVPSERRPFYSDGITLLGWGSVFDRSLTESFKRYLNKYPMDDLFLRECDRIFTGLNACRNIDVGFEHLPHAHAADRMCAETHHISDLQQIRRRIYEVR